MRDQTGFAATPQFQRRRTSGQLNHPRRAHRMERAFQPRDSRASARTSVRREQDSNLQALAGASFQDWCNSRSAIPPAGHNLGEWSASPNCRAVSQVEIEFTSASTRFWRCQAHARGVSLRALREAVFCRESDVSWRCGECRWAHSSVTHLMPVDKRKIASQSARNDRVVDDRPSLRDCRIPAKRHTSPDFLIFARSSF